MPFGLGKLGAGSKTKAGVFDGALDGEEERKKRAAQGATNDDNEETSKRKSRRPPHHGRGPPPPCNQTENENGEMSENDETNGKSRRPCGRPRGPPRGPPPNGNDDDFEGRPPPPDEDFDDREDTESESFRRKRNSYNLNNEHKIDKRSENIRIRRCGRGRKNGGGGTGEPGGDIPQDDTENVRRKRHIIKNLQTVSFDMEMSMKQSIPEHYHRRKRQQTHDPDNVIPHPDQERDPLGEFVEGVTRVVKKFVSLFQSDSAEANDGP